MELIDQSSIMKGILDSYPYPIVFVDDTYTIRFLNRVRGVPLLPGAGRTAPVAGQKHFRTATTRRARSSASGRPLRR